MLFPVLASVLMYTSTVLFFTPSTPKLAAFAEVPMYCVLLAFTLHASPFGLGTPVWMLPMLNASYWLMLPLFAVPPEIASASSKVYSTERYGDRVSSERPVTPTAAVTKQKSAKNSSLPQG